MAEIGPQAVCLPQDVQNPDTMRMFYTDMFRYCGFNVIDEDGRYMKLKGVNTSQVEGLDHYIMMDVPVAIPLDILTATITSTVETGSMTQLI